jgi:mono/diheme cytochrome c family protein
MGPLSLRAARALGALVLPVAFGACSWFTDFKDQPSIEPWEPVSQNRADSLTPPRGQPQYSVPIQGTLSPALLVSHTPAPATLDSLAAIANPTAADARSIENGRKHYQINCAVCHGLAGDGNGTIKRVNPAYAWSPSLQTAQAKGYRDGYIYGIIRNGRGAMPSYARLEEEERWDVVNYLRALQAGTGDTTLVGYPGQNGATVPGPSRTAPTRPVPYARFTIPNTPGSPGINSATFRGDNDRENYRKLHGAPHAEKGAAGETTKGGSAADSKEKHE